MRRVLLVFGFIALTVGSLILHRLAWPGTSVHATAQLDGPGFALVSDPARQQLYVSVPSVNEVDILSMNTLDIVNRVVLGGQKPMGMSLSLDGSKLYVALNQSGSVGIIDLATLATTSVDASAALGDSRAWDVVEGRPNRLYVSANPGSSGFSYLAQIATDNSNLVTRFPSGGIIRAAPIFVASPDHQSLYVGESAFSPQSLHKFAINTDAPSLVLDAPFGSVTGMDTLDVSPDGTRLYTASGEILRTDTLTRVGATLFGVPRVSADGSNLYVGSGTTVHQFDRTTLVESAQFASPCNIGRLVLGQTASELFALGSGGVCRVPLTPTPTPTATSTAQLSGPGFALVSDPARQQLYVSVPTANEVDVLSMNTLQRVNRVILGGQGPMGMSLSVDGSKLYVALNQGSGVGLIDLTSLTTTSIDASAALGNSRAWDVAEGRPSRVYVSANPGSSGLSYLAQIATDNSDLVTRFPSGGIIRAAPIFVASPDQQFLYVGESAFSPQSLHKFDVRTDAPSLVVDAPFGSVSGTDAMDISPDGTRLYTKSGQVLRTDTLTQVGVTLFGIPRVSADGSRLFIGSGTTIHEFDRNTLIELAQFTSPCNISRLVLSQSTSELFALGSDGVCRISLLPATPTSTPTTTPTPTLTPTPTNSPTSTPTPGPVNVHGGRSGTMRGLFGTVAFPNQTRSGGNVVFDRRLDSNEYTVLLTVENRNCAPVITSKTRTGFSFSCPGVGGAVDWAVFETRGNE